MARLEQKIGEAGLLQRMFVLHGAYKLALTQRCGCTSHYEVINKGNTIAVVVTDCGKHGAKKGKVYYRDIDVKDLMLTPIPLNELVNSKGSLGLKSSELRTIDEFLNTINNPPH